MVVMLVRFLIDFSKAIDEIHPTPYMYNSKTWMLLNLFHQPFAFVDSISVIHWMVLELPHTRA